MRYRVHQLHLCKNNGPAGFLARARALSQSPFQLFGVPGEILVVFPGMHCKNELFDFFIPAGELPACTLAFQVQVVSILSVRFTMISGDRATFMVIVPVQATPLPGQVVFSSEKYLFAIISK